MKGGIERGLGEEWKCDEDKKGGLIWRRRLMKRGSKYFRLSRRGDGRYSGLLARRCE